MNKRKLALIGIVMIIILAVIFVGRGLTKRSQEIFSPTKEKENFLQQYSLPDSEDIAEPEPELVIPSP